MRRTLLCLLLVTLSHPVLAEQWQVVNESISYVDDDDRRVAIVTNKSGHTLRVYSDDDGVVRGMFAIRDGLIRLSDSMCPTYRVDERQPQVVQLGTDDCDLEAKRAHFVLGKQENGKIFSTPLHRLMNGTSVVFSYQLSALGYQETEFSLSRSKQAVRGAIGREIPIDKE